jgi:hypothetical protein
MDVVPLLVHGEEQLLVQLVQALLAHVRRLHLLHQLLEARVVGEHLDQPLVLRHPALREQQLLTGGELVALGSARSASPISSPTRRLCRR